MHDDTPNIQPNSADQGATNPGPVPDAMIDALLDGELNHDQKLSLFNDLQRDPDAARNLVTTQRAIAALKDQPQSPDFTAAIIRTIDRKQGFVDGRLQRTIRIGRIAAVLAITLGLGAAFTAQRFAPNRGQLVAAPTPIKNLSNAVPQEAGQVLLTVSDELATTVTCLSEEFSPRQLINELTAQASSDTPQELIVRVISAPSRSATTTHLFATTNTPNQSLPLAPAEQPAWPLPSWSARPFSTITAAFSPTPSAAPASSAGCAFIFLPTLSTQDLDRTAGLVLPATLRDR